ncbi:MAG: bile acid:sodium symporter [Cyanobacteria bacterium J06638_7]
MNLLTTLLVSGTLFVIMFALGLGLPGTRLDLLRHRPALLLRVLLGTCVLVPLMAMLLLRSPLSLELSQPARFGIALMAICPSAPLTLRKAGKTGGSAQLAAHLQVGAAVAAIASIPLMAELFTSVYRVEGWEILPGSVALQVGKAQILPLACGLLLRRWRPGWAERWVGLFDKLANLLLLLLILAVLAKAAPDLFSYMGTNLLAMGFMGVMVLAALLIGFVLAGPDPQERTTVSLVTSMRNPGLALLFAQIHAPTMVGLKLSILAYLLLTVLLSVPFLVWRTKAAATVA